MTIPIASTTQTERLVAVAQRARQIYAACVAGIASAPRWWTSIIVTASSERQAERYRAEIQRRRERGKIPQKAWYSVVSDPGKRIGSGGATLNALCETAKTLLLQPGTAEPGGLTEWWRYQRVLLIHCGGDSRRLPQYSLAGKLFSSVGVEAQWGEARTVFDEMLALSSAWAERMPAGLVVGSGDVILTFDAAAVNWERPGVTGIGLWQPAEVGTGHGVYVADEQGRVYAFLQKPSIAEMIAAGAFQKDGMVAVDSGLLRFDPPAAARLTELAGVSARGGEWSVDPTVLPEMWSARDGELDLYRHFTMALTGQWTPDAGRSPQLHALAAALRNLPFWCSAVPGDFTHIGTTSLFRRLMTENSEFSRIERAQRRWGAVRQPGVSSAGAVTDSVLAGGADLKPGTVVIECDLNWPVRAAAGAVLHGLEGISSPIDIPENTVIHQVPILLPNGKRGVVMRVYGVDDDPKAAEEQATWFGRPLWEWLQALRMEPDAVWPDVPAAERTLWNGRLFPLGAVDEVWACAQWMMRLNSAYDPAEWKRGERLSLAGSTEWADAGAIEAARERRMKASWCLAAVSLVESGADIRPLLANAPGAGPLAETGERLWRLAGAAEETAPTDAASLYFTAGLFQAQAGLAQESDQSHEAAFRMVAKAVEMGSGRLGCAITSPWRHDEVTVVGPARIDLGGGWSDSPPFCLDWGGTVLNLALELNGACPIQATVRRLADPVIRCISEVDGSATEYWSCEQILEAASPGNALSIPRTALKMTGLFLPGKPLAQVLERMNGGLEIRSEVHLPMGSGLGASSILSACVLRAIAEMAGEEIDHQVLSDRVMQLEQLMTTGGGWQDQAGGIFPGAKLLLSGPGLRQRIRVQPLAWTAGRRAEFEAHLVLYYTGIRRVARDLLRQVVGRYLARETACLQVLHSIKTLAIEMGHAMVEGEWRHLGELLDRHWKLNQVLDPNTINAPIHTLLEAVRPYIHGAKLAGAGGGGFLIMIARSPEAAGELRSFLGKERPGSGGSLYDFAIANEGLRVRRG